MLEERNILRWQRFINRSYYYELLFTPVFLLFLNSALNPFHFGTFTSATSWIFWFVRNEYEYASGKFGNDRGMISLLHFYEALIIASLITSTLRILSVAIVLGVSRYKMITRYWGPTIIPNLTERARKFPFGLIGMLLTCAVMIFGGFEFVLFFDFDLKVPIFRTWIEKSFVTFVAAQLFGLVYALMFTYYTTFICSILLLNVCCKAFSGEVRTN